MNTAKSDGAQLRNMPRFARCIQSARRLQCRRCGSLHPFRQATPEHPAKWTLIPVLALCANFLGELPSINRLRHVPIGEDDLVLCSHLPCPLPKAKLSHVTTKKLNISQLFHTLLTFMTSNSRSFSTEPQPLYRVFNAKRSRELNSTLHLQPSCGPA